MATTTRDPIDQEGKARIDAQEAQAAAGGWALPKAFFPNGTLFYDGCDATFRLKRDAIENQPGLDDLDKLRGRIAQERREDHIVDLKSLRLQGRDLTAAAFGSVKFEERLFRKLAARATPEGAAYLANCPPNLAALNMNFWLGHASNADSRAQVRTRECEGGGGRQGWALVGPDYGKFDIDQLAAKLQRVARKDARVQWSYDGYGGSIDINFASPIDAAKARVGEIFHAGYRFLTADDGTMSYRGYATVTRAVCRNVSTITSEQEVARVIHRGENVEDGVTEAIAKCDAKIATFADAWAAAKRDAIAKSDDDFRTKIAKLVDRGLVSAPGVSKQALAGYLVEAWQKEPGYSRSDLANAVNRIAHERAWPGASPWTSRQLEAQAGDLIYARVSVN